MHNFTNSEVSQIFGETIISGDFDDLFSDDAIESVAPTSSNIDSIFIPSAVKPLELLLAEAATSWLTHHKILEAIDQLLSIDITNIDFNYIKYELARCTIPGKWAYYSFAAHDIAYLDHPLPADYGLIFDTETFVNMGNYPIIATAIGASGVYIYTHDSFSGKEYCNKYIDLGDYPRLIVAHNASFDYELIKQRFQFNNKVHTLCTQGMGRALYSIDSTNDWRLNATDKKSLQIQAELASRLNLIALYKFTTGKSLFENLKDTRNIFVDATVFSEFRVNPVRLFEYAINDSILTLELFQNIFPKFNQWLASPVCLQGFIQSADALLPVSNNFDGWFDSNIKLAAQIEYKIFKLLLPYIEKLHKHYQAGWLCPSDHFMLNQLNWGPAKPKGYRKKVLPIGWPSMTKWYFAFMSQNMSMSGNDLVYLLQLQWQGEDLVKTKKQGWATISGIRLPHPSGDSKQNLGGLFAAPVKAYVEQDLLTSKLVNKEVLLELYSLLDSRSLVDSYGERIRAMKLSS